MSQSDLKLNKNKAENLPYCNGLQRLAKLNFEL